MDKEKLSIALKFLWQVAMFLFSNLSEERKEVYREILDKLRKISDEAIK